jgi:hypothetical protein
LKLLVIAAADSVNGKGQTSSSIETRSSLGASGTLPSIDWLPIIKNSLPAVALAHALMTFRLQKRWAILLVVQDNVQLTTGLILRGKDFPAANLIFLGQMSPQEIDECVLTERPTPSHMSR